MTLNGVMTVTLRYFTEFGKHAFQHITASICGGIYARVFFLYSVVRVRCRDKESSRSLSHLLMSFLSHLLIHCNGSEHGSPVARAVACLAHEGANLGFDPVGTLIL